MEKLKNLKNEMRRQVALRWARLSEEQKEIMNRKATKRISETLEFFNADRIFLFAPEKKHEISCFEPIFEKYPEKSYYFPKIFRKEIKFFRTQNIYDMKPGTLGILEPEETEPATPDNQALLFVPAVAADRTLSRLGRGGGYYDQFFEKNLLGKRICILPFFAVYNEIPAGELDQKIHEIFEI